MKIKCYSGIECEVWHIKEMLQVFLNKEDKPKYGRIRHSQKTEDKKTIFSYHPQSLAYISQKISLCNDDLCQKDAFIGKANSSSISKLEPSAGFGPATITLPRIEK
jgi:hypothetical protein